MLALKTTKSDTNVGRPYEVLRARYGACPHNDNRPAYLRLHVECLDKGKVVHEVVHLIHCELNQRSPVFVLRDFRMIFKLLNRMDYKPTSALEFEVCDLSAFLLATRQRKVVTPAEFKILNQVRKLAARYPLDVVVKLGEPEFSHELVDYIENLIHDNSWLTPTFQRMGYVNRKHELNVVNARKALGLWK